MLFSRQRALDYMRRCELDALVATSPVNVTYFTDYYIWIGGKFKEFMVKPGGSGDLMPTFALFPVAGEPALAVEASLACNAMDLWVRDLCLFGGNTFHRSAPPQSLEGREKELFDLMSDAPYAPTAVDAFVRMLKERGLADARIGLELEGLPPPIREAVRQALPAAELLDCSNLIRLIRMVKSAEEIERLTRGAAIAEEAAAASLAHARPGLSTLELARYFRLELATRNVDLDHFAFSVKGMGIATETDYLLAEDDVLYVDYGCVYKYCCSDSGLTLAMAPLCDESEKKYQALRQCLQAGQRAMLPGARASSVPDAMWEILRPCGISASFPHGHGVGLEVRDYPVLVANTGLRIQDDCVDEPSDLPLEENMVLNLEAMIFAPGTDSLHIEQSFIVGADGGQPLTRQDRDHAFYPGETP